MPIAAWIKHYASVAIITIATKFIASYNSQLLFRIDSLGEGGGSVTTITGWQPTLGYSYGVRAAGSQKLVIADGNDSTKIWNSLDGGATWQPHTDFSRMSGDIVIDESERNLMWAPKFENTGLSSTTKDTIAEAAVPPDGWISEQDMIDHYGTFHADEGEIGIWHTPDGGATWVFKHVDYLCNLVPIRVSNNSGVRSGFQGWQDMNEEAYLDKTAWYGNGNGNPDNAAYWTAFGGWMSGPNAPTLGQWAGGEGAGWPGTAPLESTPADPAVMAVIRRGVDVVWVSDPGFWSAYGYNNFGYIVGKRDDLKTWSGDNWTRWMNFLIPYGSAIVAPLDDGDTCYLIASCRSYPAYYADPNDANYPILNYGESYQTTAPGVHIGTYGGYFREDISFIWRVTTAGVIATRTDLPGWGQMNGAWVDKSNPLKIWMLRGSDFGYTIWNSGTWNSTHTFSGTPTMKEVDGKFYAFFSTHFETSTDGFTWTSSVSYPATSEYWNTWAPAVDENGVVAIVNDDGTVLFTDDDGATFKVSSVLLPVAPPNWDDYINALDGYGEQIILPFAPGSGIDVSHYQGAINWATALAAGVAFAFLKATQGASNTDSQFATNWAGAGAQAIARGAYHYFENATDPTTQANHFVAIAASAGELGYVVDCEDESAALVPANLKTFLDRVETLTGRKCIIYTRASWWNAYVGSQSWTPDYPLWVASWNTLTPILPTGWSSWAYWQYSSHGNGATYGAESTFIDLNKLAGG